jgi:hypothetical protein
LRLIPRVGRDGVTHHVFLGVLSVRENDKINSSAAKAAQKKARLSQPQGRF